MDDESPEATEPEPVTDVSTDGSDSDGYSRRGFIEAASAMAGAAALAGCSGNKGSKNDKKGNSSGSSNNNGNAKKKSTQDFIFWTMRGYNPSVKNAITSTAKGFEDTSDKSVNVQTNVIVWAQVFPKWNAAIQGRTTPNVSEMACEHAVNFGSLGAVKPNTDLYNQYDDWHDAMNVWSKYDGDHWGMPWFVETRPLVYRKDILEKAGHSKPPSTWKEMVRIAQDVSQNTDYPGFVRAGARDFEPGQHMFGLNSQAGSSFYKYENDKWKVNFDSAGTLFSHLFWASQGKKGWDFVQDGWTSMKGTAKSKYFRTKGGGMSQDEQTTLRKARSDEKFKHLRDKLGVEKMPKGPDGTRKTFMGGSCLSQFSDKVTKYSADGLDKKFVQYMLKPDRQADYFEAAAPIFMPVRKSQEKMKLFTSNPTKLPDEWLNSFVEQARDVRRYGVYGGDRDVPFLGAVEGNTTGYSVALSAILGADKDPKKAIVNTANNIRDDANKKLDYTLQKNKKEPSLKDAPDEVQDWIHGTNNTPKIWNPYK